jgi:hypothetical protein
MSAYTLQQNNASTTETEAAPRSERDKGSLILVAYLGSIILVMMPWLALLAYATWRMVSWLVM